MRGDRPLHRRHGGRGSSGRFGDVFNPNTGEVQAQVALATAADLERAVAAAAGARSRPGPRPTRSAARG